MSYCKCLLTAKGVVDSRYCSLRVPLPLGMCGFGSGHARFYLQYCPSMRSLHLDVGELSHTLLMKALAVSVPERHWQTLDRLVELPLLAFERL